MRQLVIEDRIVLGWLLQWWVDRKKIVKVIWCSDRTIRREIARWSIDGIYYPKIGQEYVEEWRRNNSISRTILLQDNWYREYLLEEMSPWLVTPDSIAGSKKRRWEEFVSSKTIYNFIWLYNEWLRKLLTYKKRYRKRHSRQWKRPGWYKHINERPIEAIERSETWHTEIDLVLSRRRGWWVMTLVDRKSRYWLIKKVRTKESKEINKILWRMIRKEWLQKKLKTITSDNGHEFFWLRHIEKKYWFQQYYADPYSSQQRWTNEQYNWQIRKIFPKWTDFSKVRIRTIQEIQTKLNRKPRKILWYRTPEEVFYSD